MRARTKETSSNEKYQWKEKDKGGGTRRGAGQSAQISDEVDELRATKIGASLLEACRGERSLDGEGCGLAEHLTLGSEQLGIASETRMFLRPRPPSETRVG